MVGLVYPSRSKNPQIWSKTMTYQEDFTLPIELLELIATNDFHVIPELIRIVFNATMQAERQRYVRAAPYQRTLERQDQANGYKQKMVKTRLGVITCDVPQVRESGFYPEALEKGLRSERALAITLAEM
jgi:putative transposase